MPHMCFPIFLQFTLTSLQLPGVKLLISLVFPLTKMGRREGIDKRGERNTTVLVHGGACSFSQRQWTVEILTSFLLSYQCLSQPYPRLHADTLSVFSSSLPSSLTLFKSPFLTYMLFLY